MKPIIVGLDRRLLPWVSEIKYVFRTLLRVAGYAYVFVWEDDTGSPMDIYYGFDEQNAGASVRIMASNKHFTGAPWFTPDGYYEQGELPFLDFGEGEGNGFDNQGDNITFSSDIIFTSYWLLTGGHEQEARRDRWDNLHLDDSFFLQHELTRKPIVSIYGRFLRTYFEQSGQPPHDLPWSSGSGKAAFAFSHDVDYPEIIQWIESLRLLRQQEGGGIGTIANVLRGRSHFWQFSRWVEFAKQWDTRPAFYFMVRQGSLLKYALGTPDAFYDIEQPAFSRLFSYLQFEDCEIGLHASFDAFRQASQIRIEKEKLEAVTGMTVSGNRHHYWHINPAAPHETLLFHEQAGLLYDSSLALDFYPGFRRGICHPFHVFHPGEGREIETLQLPPAWMDDHFDRRLEKNGIVDPTRYANLLVQSARETGGIILLDYHVRGMNRDFYPRYGAWLEDYLQAHVSSREVFLTPAEIARTYRDYEGKLAAHSRDETEPDRFSLSLANDSASNSAVTIHHLEAGTEEEWDRFADGRFYHTLAWRDVTEQGLGHQPHYIYARNIEGEVAGVLPLFLVKGLFGRRLVSLPMRDRGGLLTEEPRAAASLIEEAIALTKTLDCRYLELRSFEGIDADLSARYDLRCQRQWTTTRIDLSPGTEKLWQELDRKSIRWAVNKSRREGARFEINKTEAGIEIFYDLFVRTRCEMGIPPFPKQLFTAIYDHLIAREKANLFLIWKDDVPIHGMINFLSKDIFIPAYAAPQNEFRKLYPNELMFWSAIEWAAEHDFRYLDFGADSPRQMGLLWFKKKWGGIHYPMTYCYYLNDLDEPPDFDSSSPTYEMMRKAWTYLPEPLCRHLGSLVTRQLS